MKVSINATCKNKNHVGKNWSYVYQIDGITIKNNSRINLTAGQKIIVYSKVVENDKYPDVGTNSSTYVITDKDIKNGFKIKMSVSVREDKGRYAGNSCTWTIVFSFK